MFVNYLLATELLESILRLLSTTAVFDICCKISYFFTILKATIASDFFCFNFAGNYFMA